MTGALERQAARIAVQAGTAWRDRIADRLRSAGGIDVEVRDDGIVARGRRLRARWLRDAGLRWIGGWM